ncbi:hypothetical protein PC129_g6196 [Phytophthora cactorum]|uniref:Uncharacterized protein n=1 Tax=Phytophthora cactorum TaxID=29920 RepID=A0A329SKE4_9STRA|nr:hypothetical protein Pcac1_g4034 [Phytophthora cactorum]KAG2839634.1 hypothetical protein PC112_g4051 [Phytophthora cactorum]KAG2844031.1 hypothetical protein PC111_g2141 [Phytophthora cactorum]KAG2865932.1 hypothetical protein PC113_g3277 [Phytophthora cactorum]KAG2928208.1 hypothetical protein PC114_g3226 [Phytophthora cactorum]
MGRRAREASDDSAIAGRSLKHVKLLQDGLDISGDIWSWRNLLERLHFLLDNELERDAIAWLEDGSQFIVEHTGDVKLAQLLGLRVCSVHQVLEALNFECLDESHWDFSIYRHGCFVRGDPHKIEQIAGYDSLSAEKDVVMPNIAYSSELKPLEVRLSLSDSQSQSWEVTIAPSVLPRPAFDTGENFHFQESAVFESSMGESSWGDIFDNSEELSDHDMNSPIWWSQRSDFSSICTDDLSDMDTLSQISAFYG